MLISFLKCSNGEAKEQLFSSYQESGSPNVKTNIIQSACNYINMAKNNNGLSSTYKQVFFAKV